MLRWDKNLEAEVENPKVDAFLLDLVAVMKKHGMSLSHEDTQGGFEVVQKFDESKAGWLLEASIT